MVTVADLVSELLSMAAAVTVTLPPASQFSRTRREALGCYTQGVKQPVLRDDSAASSKLTFELPRTVR
jgi:hypothetical protein